MLSFAYYLYSISTGYDTCCQSAVKTKIARAFQIIFGAKKECVSVCVLCKSNPKIPQNFNSLSNARNFSVMSDIARINNKDCRIFLKY